MDYTSALTQLLTPMSSAGKKKKLKLRHEATSVILPMSGTRSQAPLGKSRFADSIPK